MPYLLAFGRDEQEGILPLSPIGEGQETRSIPLAYFCVSRHGTEKQVREQMLPHVIP
jgi:hypothetical protein